MGTDNLVAVSPVWQKGTYAVPFATFAVITILTGVLYWNLLNAGQQPACAIGLV